MSMTAQPATAKNQALIQRVFRALTYRDFRLMWLGACISTIGTFVQQFAQSWLVFDGAKVLDQGVWPAHPQELPVR